MGWEPQKAGGIVSISGNCDKLCLRREDGWTLTIRKGFENGTDRTMKYLEYLGYNARGKQPDIVMCFRPEDDNVKPVYIIADAKRNAGGDGNHYIRSAFFAMLNDFIAFGHKLGLSINSDKEDCFTTPVYPAGILFFKQMEEKKPFENGEAFIAGVDFDDYSSCFNSTDHGREGRLYNLLEYINNQI